MPSTTIKLLQSEEEILRDVELAGRIPIVASMFEVICRTTGMGFAAIAKVTRERWIACGVRDEIRFGLGPGSELKVETTICDEIRDSGKIVVIDHVEKDPQFCDHHTPRMYGFQSYISVPIFLKNGDFFGTLCAIDPKPAQLNNPQTIGMFVLFAELISFHLAVLYEKEQTELLLQHNILQMIYYREENRQYQHLSNHNLQEPLRKIRIFSDLLVTSGVHREEEKVRATAIKINNFAQDLSEMLHDLTDFSGHQDTENDFEPTDLLQIFLSVTGHLQTQLAEKNATVRSDLRHSVVAIRVQIVLLFDHLFNNSLQYSRKDAPPNIYVYSRDLPSSATGQYAFLQSGRQYCEIFFEDRSIELESPQLGKIFDISPRITNDGKREGLDIRLAQCRKIVRQHGGTITADSRPEKGVTFSIILPLAG